MKHLFFVEQPYSFAILRPLEKAALARGDQVFWFLFGLAIPDFLPPDRVLAKVKDVEEFQPDSVIAPGNWVPHFFPGLKVQIFHGFGIEKTGHFRIRGLFDLYCTHGPLTTDGFARLRKRHAHFNIVETGWPKLDPWASRGPAPQQIFDPVRVLYAPTFSPRLSSSKALFPQWQQVSQSPGLSVTVKFHPLEDTGIVQQYAGIGDRLEVDKSDDILPLIAECDILVSDTSSVVAEAICLGKPVLVFQPKAPADHARRFDDPAKLGCELSSMAQGYTRELDRGGAFRAAMHPYDDGCSSERVLDAISGATTGKKPPKSKPANLLRKNKIAKKMQPYR